MHPSSIRLADLISNMNSEERNRKFFHGALPNYRTFIEEGGHQAEADQEQHCILATHSSARMLQDAAEETAVPARELPGVVQAFLFDDQGNSVSRVDASIHPSIQPDNSCVRQSLPAMRQFCG